MTYRAHFGKGPWLRRRRDAIEWVPPTNEPQVIRESRPGPWVYELEHRDGRIEKLTEGRYYELLVEFLESVPRGQERATTQD